MLAGIINPLGQTLSNLLGGNTTSTASQPSQTSTPKAPVVDVSKDRLDLSGATEPAKEPTLAVVAYVPPVEVPKAPEQVLPQPPAPVASAEEPALPAAPADFPAAMAALAASERADDAAAPAAAPATAVATTSASTGSSVSAEADAPAATSVSAGATVAKTDQSTDEEKARAMAIKALEHERRLNMASDLMQTATASSVAATQKAAAQASAEVAETKRPALLVA